MSKKTHRQRCQEECTRDVVFLLQICDDRKKRLGHWMNWRTESVWLDRSEAKRHLAEHCHNYPKDDRVRIYGIPSEGALAAMLRAQDAKVAI